MTDSAQPTTGLVRRLVGDPNSTIGALIKRGVTGATSAGLVNSDKKLPADNSTASAKTLNTLEETLNQVEALSPPTAEPPIKTNPSVTSRKEAVESVSLDQVALDAARGVQEAEAEPQPEISPEVESYLQKVEEQKDSAPQEIVIADGSQTTPTDHPYPAQPVVVLPITAEEEKVGVKKSPKFSVRWLVEWSRRLMKVFMGKIIYRPLEESQA